ncbi:tol-pal system protein YbgF [Desulfurivibrio sp. D14AmB]|uniref:tol-pal system protein YbgF n=1 Tax=Desulfurivibrio sp. D14AmB TaxID=3374370 RepID=UPI00376F3FD8
MKKSMLSFALLAGLTPFMVQCVATEQDLRGVDLRTRTLDNRLSEVERLTETVRSQAAAQARLGSDLGSINDRLLQHQGRMEETDHQLARAREQQEAAQRNTSIRLDNIDIKLKEVAELLEARDRNLTAALDEMTRQQRENSQQIQELREQRAREAAERAAAAARAAEAAKREAEERARREAAERERARTASAPARAPAGGPKEIVPENMKQKVDSAESAPTPTAPASRPETRAEATPAPAAGQNLYEQGRNHLRDKKYQDAYAALARFLEQTPRGETAAEARFLLGESLYHLKEFELAILEYQKLIADFPGNARIPEALLRQGMAFEELREPSTAAIIYERLAGEFPNSNQAKQARERLQKIR